MSRQFTGLALVVLFALHLTLAQPSQRHKVGRASEGDGGGNGTISSVETASYSCTPLASCRPCLAEDFLREPPEPACPRHLDVAFKRPVHCVWIVPPKPPRPGARLLQETAPARGTWDTEAGTGRTLPSWENCKRLAGIEGEARDFFEFLITISFIGLLAFSILLWRNVTSTERIASRV